VYAWSMQRFIPRNHYRIGLILGGLAALCWSLSGIFTRLISADLMTMLFWRGLFSGTAVLIVHVMMSRGQLANDFKKLGWPAVGVAMLSAMSMICGIGAIRYGKAADVMVIYAIAPFVTAGLAYLFFREKAGLATIMTSLAAFVGVIIMLWGNDFGGETTGIILAVFMMLGMAGFSTLLRYARDVPMLPAMAGSAFLAAAICFWLAQPLNVSSQDIVLIAAF
jgi:drug/metabolite transporter (DMT)-like permease